MLKLSMILSFVLAIVFAFGTNAFVPSSLPSSKRLLSLNAIPTLQNVNSKITSTVPTSATSNMIPKIFQDMNYKIIIASTAVLMTIPQSVLAAVIEDDYEYGKVDAPIGLAWGVGVLAILTALLPIALRGGEEAFNEMSERDSKTFGKNNNDILNSKKK